MKNIKFLLKSVIIALSIIVIGLSSCKKSKTEESKPIDPETLKRLYYIYRDGAIEECKLNGEIIYCGQYNNVYDGSRYVYEKGGKLIGACNYRSPKPDTICLQITDCETIYRIKDNFWGLPEVDKYELGK